MHTAGSAAFEVNDRSGGSSQFMIPGGNTRGSQGFEVNDRTGASYFRLDDDKEQSLRSIGSIHVGLEHTRGSHLQLTNKDFEIS